MNQPASMPKNVDEYIAGFPAEVRRTLEQLRATVKTAAPEAVERIAYGMPTYTLHGNLVHFAAHKDHIGFYPTPSGIEALRDELAPYVAGKGSLRFPQAEPVPFDLVRRIVLLRVEENVARAADERSRRRVT